MMATGSFPRRASCRTRGTGRCCGGITRELQEFHPDILLITTHKITRIMANFRGISKLIQSILPSLSTCNSRSFQDTWASCVCQQEINGASPPFVRGRFHPGAPGATDAELTKSQKTGILLGSLGVSGRPAGARGSTYPQVIHMLLWITLVEFGSFS